MPSPHSATEPRKKLYRGRCVAGRSCITGEPARSHLDRGSLKVTVVFASAQIQGVAVVVLRHDVAQGMRGSGHARGEPVQRRLRAEDRNELYRVDRVAISSASSLAPRRCLTSGRALERPLHRHLLVEQHADHEGSLSGSVLLNRCASRSAVIASVPFMRPRRSQCAPSSGVTIGRSSSRSQLVASSTTGRGVIDSLRRRARRELEAGDGPRKPLALFREALSALRPVRNGPAHSCRPACATSGRRSVRCGRLRRTRSRRYLEAAAIARSSGR